MALLLVRWGLRRMERLAVSWAREGGTTRSDQKGTRGRRDRPGIADSTCLHASSRLRRRRSGQSVHGEPRVARDTYSKTWRPTYHEPRAILSERHVWLPDFPDLAGHCESPFLGSNGQLAWLPT